MSDVLAFMSVAAADAGAVARSSLERVQRDAGARFEERSGWLVPVAIPGEEERSAVGVADLSHLVKLEVRPAPAAAPTGETVVHYRISPRRALVLCEPREAESVRAQLSGRIVLDVTGGLVVIALAGPEAHTAIGRLTHLHHFPSGGEVAHVTAHVLAPAPERYWVVAAQELGQYLWEVTVDIAAALGGGPVGVDAL